jgi:hypothetical protein
VLAVTVIGEIDMPKKIPFIEKGCKVRFKGKSFESGGSFIGKHKKTGKFGGILYAYPRESKVGDWKGTWKVPAKFGYEWTSNMGDRRQTVEFDVGKRKFTGTYFKSGSDIVRVREKAKKVI